MAEQYCVVRTDLVSGTKQPADLVTVQVYDDNLENLIEVENGTIVELVGFDEDNREVRKAKPATSASKLSDCALIASEEVFYDERKHNLDLFINEKDSLSRGYLLRSNNVFSVTALGFTDGKAANVKAKSKVGIGAKGKIDPAGTGLGTVIRVEDVGRYTYYMIKLGVIEA